MQPQQVDLMQLKERMRRSWMAGDFGQVAQFTSRSAEEFVARLPISAGMRVLDVACGTGNLAIPAARIRACVTGVDIAPNLLAQARRRAAAEQLDARFEEGDAEQLPYPDRQFGLVMSMFGAMFAPRPERVAAELIRVCKPGGTIAMANWTPDGFPAKMFLVTGRYVPPPDGIPAPVLWGDEQTVRERFRSGVARLTTTRREILFDYPFPPPQVVQFFRDYFGPTQAAFARLEPAKEAALAADLDNLWREHNQSGEGRTVVQTDYLEVIAERA